MSLTQRNLLNVAVSVRTFRVTVGRSATNLYSHVSSWSGFSVWGSVIVQPLLQYLQGNWTDDATFSIARFRMFPAQNKTKGKNWRYCKDDMKRNTTRWIDFNNSVKTFLFTLYCTLNHACLSLTLINIINKCLGSRVTFNPFTQSSSVTGTRQQEGQGPRCNANSRSLWRHIRYCHLAVGQT